MPEFRGSFILVTMLDVCVWGGAGRVVRSRVENRDLQVGTTKDKMDEQSPRKKQLLQSVSVTKGNLTAALFDAGKVQFGEIRNDLWPSVFNSRAVTLSPLLPQSAPGRPGHTHLQTLHFLLPPLDMLCVQPCKNRFCFL